MLRFPEHRNHTSGQLVRIEGAFPAQVDVWIANLYIISARLVDLYLPKGKGSIQGEVNLWTNNVTLQDTPKVANTNDAELMIFPPHNKRHEGVGLSQSIQAYSLLQEDANEYHTGICSLQRACSSDKLMPCT